MCLEIISAFMHAGATLFLVRGFEFAAGGFSFTSNVNGAILDCGSDGRGSAVWEFCYTTIK